MDRGNEQHKTQSLLRKDWVLLPPAELPAKHCEAEICYYITTVLELVYKYKDTSRSKLGIRGVDENSEEGT